MFAINTGRNLQLTDRDLALILSGASYSQGELNLDSVIAVINDPGHGKRQAFAFFSNTDSFRFSQYHESRTTDVVTNNLSRSLFGI